MDESDIDRLIAKLGLELPDLEPDGEDDESGEDQEWLGWSAFAKPRHTDEEGDW